MLGLLLETLCGSEDLRAKLIYCHYFSMVFIIDPRGIRQMVLSAVWAQCQILISSLARGSCFAYIKLRHLKSLGLFAVRTQVCGIRTLSGFLIGFMVFLRNQE